MNTLCPNGPVVAAEVNTNFQILANLISGKTGSLASTSITSPGR